MEDHARNPAGRLWLFLSYINENGAAGEAALPEVARYIGAEPRTAEFYTAVAMLVKQPPLMKEAIENMANSPAPIEDLLSEHHRVVAALDEIANPNVQLEGIRRQYDAGTLTSLKFTSHMLNSAEPLVSGPTSTVDSIRAAAEALRRLVVDDTIIDSSVRRILFELVDAIIRALDLLKVAGTDVVLGEFDRFYGRYRRVPQLRGIIAQHPKIANGLMALGGAVNALATLINGGVALEGAVDNLLSIEGSTITIAPGDSSGANGSV